MKDRKIEEIVSLTKALINEQDQEWGEETENAYHELNADERTRKELEQQQKTDDFDKFKEFAEKKLKEKGYNDDDIGEVDWDTVYGNDEEESGMMESQELHEESDFGYDFDDEEDDNWQYAPDSRETFYVRIEHEGYSWAAEYVKERPESPLDGYGEWEPVGAVTQEEPHPDFYKIKVDAKATPQKAVELLRDSFDFVGEPTDHPDVEASEDREDVVETDISYRGLVDDLESIMSSCETKNLMEDHHGGPDSYDSVEENLYLYIVNSGDLYRQVTDPLIQNLKKKADKGVYAENKAMNSWLKLADEGAKRYFNEIGSEEGEELTWHSMFPPVVRNNVARDLADYYSQLIFEDSMMEAKKKKKKKKKKEFVGNSDAKNDQEGLDENNELKEFMGVVENMEYGDQDENGKLERIQRLEKEIYGDVMTHDLDDLEQSPCDYISFLHDEQGDREMMSSVPKPKVRAR